MSDKHFDVIAFGATSFVGPILWKRLLERLGADGPVKRAMAGRSQAKLGALKHSLGDNASGINTIVAEAANEDALRKMCAQTRVVIYTHAPPDSPGALNLSGSDWTEPSHPCGRLLRI